jgi:hypothetical protein
MYLAFSLQIVYNSEVEYEELRKRDYPEVKGC